MRTKLFVTVLVVLGTILLSFSKLEAQTYQWDFQKYFFLDPKLEITSCEFTQVDGGKFLYVCGVKEPGTYRGYFLMALMDPDYNLMQTNMIGHWETPNSQSTYTVKDVIPLSNGNFSIVGSMEKYCNSGLNGPVAVILTVNTSLNYVGFDYYPYVKVWNSILESVDGFVVCGQNLRHHGIIARKSNNNWSLVQQVDPNVGSSSEYTELTTPDMKEFAAVGTLNHSVSDVIVTRINTSNIIYSNIYTHMHRNQYEFGRSIVDFKDELVIAGTMTQQIAGHYYPIVFKIDKYNGNILPSSSVVYDLNFHELDLTAIRKIDDYFFINGTVKTDIWSSTPYNHGYIFGFENGDPYNAIQNRFYGDLYNADLYFTDMNQNLMNPIQPVTGGYSDNFGNQDIMWIVERFQNINNDCHSKHDMPIVHDYPIILKSLEMIKNSVENKQVEFITKNYNIDEKVICDRLPAKSSIIDIEKQQVDPSGVKLWVSEKQIHIEGIDEAFEYQVYTLSGRLITSGNAKSGYQTVDVSDLNNGMYICKVFTTTNNYQIKFIR